MISQGMAIQWMETVEEAIEALAKVTHALAQGRTTTVYIDIGKAQGDLEYLRISFRRHFTAAQTEVERCCLTVVEGGSA